jgi:hypothetical protein
LQIRIIPRSDKTSLSFKLKGKKLMSTRNAESPIKGYNYQFLHTIKDILDNTVDIIATPTIIKILDSNPTPKSDDIKFYSE